MESIKYGWNKFTKNAGPFVLAALLVLVVGGLISFLGQLLAAGIFDTSTTTTVDPNTGALQVEGGGGLFAGLLVNGVVSFIGQLVTTLLAAGLLKMAFDVVDGKQASLGTMLEGWDKVQLLVAAILTSILTAIGLILCVLPGIAVLFFTAFTSAFVVDRKLGAVDAIKGSFDLVKNNLGAVLVWILLAIVCTFVGALVCLVGLLVAVPVVVISQAYTMRALHGQQVAPLST